MEIRYLDALEVDLCGHLDDVRILAEIGRCSEVIFGRAVGMVLPLGVLCEELVGEFVELTVGD